MKILRAIPSLNPSYGGPATFVRDSSRLLQALGHQVDVLSVDPDTEEARAYADGGVKHIPLGPFHSPLRWSPRVGPWLQHNIKNYDAVMTHSLWLHPTSSAAQAARAAGVPYFMFPHGGMLAWHKEQSAIKWEIKRLYTLAIEARNLRSATGILVTSTAEATDVQRWRPRVDGGNIIHLPYGAEVPAPSDIVGGPPEDPGAPYFLYLGRISWQKNIPLLLKAFLRWKRQSNSPMKLIIAGPFVPEIKIALEADLHEARGGEGVILVDRFIGPEEKWRWLRHADAFVLPSHGENFSIVTVEALGMGVPVIVSPEVAISTEVAAAKAGQVVPRNESALVEALGRLAGDAPARTVMGKRARHLYENQFSLNATASHLVRLLEDSTAATSASRMRA